MATPEMRSPAIQMAERQAERTNDFISSLSALELEMTTPCKGWLVRDIVAHMLAGGEGVSDTLQAVVDGRPTPGFDLRDQGAINQRGVAAYRDLTDLPQRFSGMIERIKGVFAQIETKGLQKTPFMFFAEMTPEQLSALLAADVATHLWDLGQAVGRRQLPDASILAGALPQMIEEVLPKTFLPDQARGLVCSYGIQLTDIPNGQWVINVNDGQIGVARKSIAKAKVKTITDAGTFVLLSYGRLNPIGQILRGKVKTRGNPLLGLKFGSLFQKV
jgi:uncharacterized protein (TIGR03083 family)